LSESWRTRPSARSGHCRMPVSVFMDSSFQSVATGARVLRWAFRGPAFRVLAPGTEWTRGVVPGWPGCCGLVWFGAPSRVLILGALPRPLWIQPRERSRGKWRRSGLGGLGGLVGRVRVGLACWLGVVLVGCSLRLGCVLVRRGGRLGVGLRGPVGSGLWARCVRMKELRGIPVSSGVAIGRVFLLEGARWRVPRRTIDADSVEGEVARLERALEASMEDLSALRTEAEAELGPEAASIFAFHQGMLRDRSLVGPMAERVRGELVSAEYAAQLQFEQVAASFSRMADDAFRTKVDDVWDLHRRVLRHLSGSGSVKLADIGEGSIVVASDLTPSQTAELPRDRVLGFVTGYGGPTSHTAIFARALAIRVRWCWSLTGRRWRRSGFASGRERICGRCWRRIGSCRRRRVTARW